MVAYRIADGELHVFRAAAVLLATGGFGRMFRVTSNAHSLTGDGVRWPTGAGVPLEDMEFYQFHPTGIVGLGILLSEAARGEGGYLLNDQGERFMERYAPTLMELAPARHGQSRHYLEIRAGRGIGGKDYVYLDLRHLGREGHRGEAARHHRLRAHLPGRRADHRAGAHPAHRPLRHGRHPHRHSRRGSSSTSQDTVLPGLYAAGECACVSVHGANRLGTNSLIDLLVFGRARGRADGRRRRAATARAGGAGAMPQSRCARELEALRDRARGREPGPHPPRAGRRR